MAILLFDRAREPGGAQQERRDVLFIDAGFGLSPGKNRIQLSDSQLAQIVTTYCQRQTVAQSTYLADFSELAANDFNLNVPRYLRGMDDGKPIDLDAALQEIEQLERELVNARTQMTRQLHALMQP